MKNEPWIDRVYKESTETWDVPVNLDHWQQAASLIDRRDKKKKRAFWIRMAGFSGAALILLLILILWRNGPSDSSPAAEPQPAGSPAAEPMAQASGTKDSQAPGLSGKADEPAENSLAQRSSSNPSPQASLSNDQSARSIGLKNNENNLRTIPSPTDPNLLSHSRINANEQSSIAANPVMLAPEREILSEEGLDPLDFMAMTSFSKALPVTMMEIPVEVDYKPFRRKEFGLRLDLTRQAENGRSASMSMAGLEVFARKTLGTKTYWDLSLGYNSFFNPSLYSAVLTSYQFQGFGSTVKNYGVKPEWIHYLYLQMAAGMQLNKHRAFAGIRPQLLLGAIGEVDQIRFKDGASVRDLSSAEISNLANGWLDKGSLHQLVFNVHLGYEYQFHPKFGLGLQASRLLNDLYRPLPGDIAQHAGAKWNLGMRISYKLK